MNVIVTKDPTTRVYRVNNVVVPSVTQILSTGGFYDFSAVDPSVLEHKREIGSAVHLACELHDRGTLDHSSVGKDIDGYLRAWRKYVADSRIIIVDIETPVGSERWGFAGTPDIIASSGKDIVVIDRKTTASMSKVTGLQLVGYAVCIKEMMFIKKVKRLGVLLKPDGTYSNTKFEDPADESVFLSAVNCLKYKIKNKIVRSN